MTSDQMDGGARVGIPTDKMANQDQIFPKDRDHSFTPGWGEGRRARSEKQQLIDILILNSLKDYLPMISA